MKGAIIPLGILAALTICVGIAELGAQDDKAPAVQADTVEVTVTGVGANKDEAERDAKRKAIEKGAGTFIYSKSETKDFMLVKDTILAKAAGFISRWEPVKPAKELEDGTWTLTIKATVSVKGIVDTWGTVTTMLKDVGWPKIMVFVRERVRGEWQDDSTVGLSIENVLNKSGFKLVDKNQIKEIEKKDLAAAVLEDKPEKVAAIAKKFGAQIFISGTVDCEADRGARGPAPGVSMHPHEAISKIKVYYSDTGDVLSAVPGKATRGSGNTDLGAAQQALDFQGQLVAAKIIADVLEHWQDAMTGGRGGVLLKVDGITPTQAIKFKKELAALPGVTDVNLGENSSDNQAEYDIRCNLPGKKFAEVLVDKLEDKLEITKIQQNNIEAKYKGTK
jgi:hypothetical protein